MLVLSQYKIFFLYFYNRSTIGAMQTGVEKTYKKVSQIQHILMRPDMYIGPIAQTQQVMWIVQNEEFINRKIKYVPGLYKIFDEILVNAADNYQRDKKMTKIDVRIEKDEITILNDGKSIPVQIHKVHKIYVPELIFGHLLTSSNYEDDQKKVTGGRNGYGAKLANIFSTQFYVEVADSTNRKLFKLTWRKNMTDMEVPTIENYDGSDYTKISFKPDFRRFPITKLTPDIVSLLKKRVYDIAGIIKVKVYLNGKLIPIPSFKEYVKKYMPNQSQTLVQTNYNKNSKWQVLASRSDGHLMQISFVNCISTSKGGTHVNYIIDQIVEKVINAIPKKNSVSVKPFQVKAHLSIFINCLIQNPSFDSQTKQNLTTNASNFGSTCLISDEFVKQLLKTGIAQRVVSQIKLKETNKIQKELKKIKKNRLIIPKLEDANEAGKSQNCTLILTEGDSAKTLALCGIEQLGRDFYGVYPLKGKLPNVKSLTPKQVMENVQLSSLVKILGLTFQKQYENISDLRYSSVMIMADQDNDGSHIKGLIINFFQTFWPSLCKIDGFLKQFITPIIKCKKGNDSLNFYSQADFNKWKEEVCTSGWSIKYYKGLGTSTAKQAKQYFSNLYEHKIQFMYNLQRDKKALELAFDKKNTDLRKFWLRQYDPEKCLDHKIKTVTIQDFINKELIHFSNSDNIRSIPSAIDGFKPSQRKILFACFKRNLNNEIKVAQLAGYVAQHSAYHHGQQSLCSTIIGMAQNFIGSNNLNLLQPIGQFGTRYQNGKDSASARYIFTKLNPLTRYLFIEADDHIISYQQQQNQIIEPKFYLPILPLVLINGAEGIGTGWSTTIHPHKVEDIIELIRNRINRVQTEILIGWQNYQGQIKKDEKGNFIVQGSYEINGEEVVIREIPPNKSIRQYKSFLEGKLQSLENEDPDLEELKEYHSNNNIQFLIRFIGRKMPAQSQISKYLKLNTSFQQFNMNLFTSELKIKKFDKIQEIVQEFFFQRMQGYQLRKKYLISKYKKEFLLIQNQIRFINEIIEGGQFKLIHSKQQWIKKLKKGNYLRYQDLNKIQSTKHREEDVNQKNKEFNYLLHLPIWNFCHEKVQQLRIIKSQLSTIINHYQNINEKDMWLKDISQFQNAWLAGNRGTQVKQLKKIKKQHLTLVQATKRPLKRIIKDSRQEQNVQSSLKVKKNSRVFKNLMEQQLENDIQSKVIKKVKVNSEKAQNKLEPLPLQQEVKKEQKSALDSILSKYLGEDNDTKKDQLSLLERMKARISGGDPVFNASYNQTKLSLANQRKLQKSKQIQEQQLDICNYLL